MTATALFADQRPHTDGTVRLGGSEGTCTEMSASAAPSRLAQDGGMGKRRQKTLHQLRGGNSPSRRGKNFSKGKGSSKEQREHARGEGHAGGRRRARDRNASPRVALNQQASAAEKAMQQKTLH